MTTNAQRQEHVDFLADYLGCAVTQRVGMPGMMYVEYEPPRIEGPVIVEQKDYMVMLHELGHVHHNHTQGRPPFDHKTFYFDNGVLRSEAEAWAYALELSHDEEFEPETRRFMWERCLNSYLSGALSAGGRPNQHLGNGNRHWIPFTYDAPDDFFWDVAELLAGRTLEQRRRFSHEVFHGIAATV